jgi:bifunctional DNA-binding transcriptional regulator/antitoxin component of YhaV-PrlF toxin-antitoxin module
LRVTIPEAIVQLLDLKAGDELLWTVTALKDKMNIVVSKKKA